MIKTIFERLLDEAGVTAPIVLEDDNEDILL